MSKTKANSKNLIPQWQSEKMRALIVERWDEIWQVVETRKYDRSK